MSTTIYDIAKACGLSRATVSRVLRNNPNVSEKSRQRVMRVIEEMGYQPNYMAQSLAQGYSNTVALIIGNISSTAQIEIVKTIQKGLYEQKLMAWLCNSDYNSALCDAYLDIAAASKLAGVFMITTSPSPKKLVQMSDRDIPTILINRQDIAASCDSILGDDQKAAYQAVNHLIALGHRKIALLSVPQTLIAGRNAYWGYSTSLEVNEVPFDESLVYNVDIESYSDALKERRPFDVATLLEEHPDITAVVCLSNEVAVDFHLQCRKMGKSIPGDLSVMCLDPVHDNQLQEITFSTYGASQQVLGEAAVSQMLRRIKARIQGEQLQACNIVLEPTFAEGNSVRKL